MHNNNSINVKIHHVLTTLLLCLSLNWVSAESGSQVNTHIEPEGLHDHPAFTNLVTVEGGAKLLFLAGQASWSAEGKCVAPGDWRAQYIQTMENLKTSLAAGGATFKDVVFIRYFVTDIDAYFKMLIDRKNPLPDYWQGQPPASTLVEISRLAEKCFLMEFDIIAAVKQE